MGTQTTAFIISCEGPPLDYTARSNLQGADILVLADGLGVGEPRFASAPRAIRLQLEATSETDALAQVQQVLSSRPYVDFEIVGGVRVG
jgi:hypothetical protein